MSAPSGYFTGGALSAIYLGWFDALAGDLEGGIARMQDQMSELKAAGSEYISDRRNALIAIALGRLRRFDDAVAATDMALQFIERTKQKYLEAELYRLRGELLAAKDTSNAAPAERSFRTAIEISRDPAG